MRKIMESIPPEPFQAWIFSRLEYHQRQVDLEVGQAGAPGAIQRLCTEIGWEWTDTNARKLYRWRHGMSDTKVGGRFGKTVSVPRKLGFERASVEDALHNAGVDFYELYPEFAHERDGSPEPEAWCPNCQNHVLVVRNKREQPVCIWCDWRMCEGHLNRSLVAA